MKITDDSPVCKSGDPVLQNLEKSFTHSNLVTS